MERKQLPKNRQATHTIANSKALSSFPDDADEVYGVNGKAHVTTTEDILKCTCYLQDGKCPVHKKHAGGRPTDYTVDMCDKVIEWGRLGFSKTQMASKLEVSRDTVFQWEKAHVEFSDAMIVAMSHSEAWWENQAHNGITQPSKEFNTGLFGKIMSCRFPKTWREVTTTQHSGPEGGPIPIAVATKQITGENLAQFYKSFMD